MFKVLKKLVYKCLVSFLIRNNYFNKSQFRFWKHHLTVHAAIILVENKTQTFSEKKPIVGNDLSYKLIAVI